MDLQDFIQEVLDNEFVGQSKKREIVPTKNGFNFACPFCGDSQKVESKKRGNVFIDSKSYKCFNDGCMVWMPLRKFVATFAQKYNIDITELDVDFDDTQFDPRKHSVKIEDNNIMRFLSESGALGTMLDLEYVKDRFSLIPARALGAASVVRRYMDDRFLFNIPNVDEYIFADASDKLMYIFNYHRQTGKIISLATRRVDYKKYKVIPYTHVCAALHLQPIKEHSQFIDQLGEYFNLLNVDFMRPIRVTEGQIDSMFLVNALALQGVTKSTFLLDYVPDDNVWTMFDRDKGGIGASVKEIQEGRRAFMWSLLISRLKRRFSPDDKDIHKMKDTNDLYSYLYKRTKLPLWRFQELVDEYFTSSKFDIVYL